MGDYFLAVRMDQEHIHESPFLIFIDHTDSDPGHCIADGKHDTGIPFPQKRHDPSNIHSNLVIGSWML